MNRHSFFVALLFFCAAFRLAAQGTAFNYQGRLSDGGSPANGTYDLRFCVYDAVTNGNAISFPLTNSAVAVSNGLFAVTLDFGAGVFTGSNYWLDIGVRTNGGTNFTGLFPRQPILPVPYAIFANSASNLLGKLTAAQFSGNLPASQVAGASSNVVSFTNLNNAFSGTFTGSGSALNNLNASQLTFGTVADARLSANVPLLNANQTFTGANTFNGVIIANGTDQFNGVNTFTNVGNRFTGSFFGNGNVGWDAFPGPTVQAEFNHGYLLTNSQPATVMLPLTPASSEGTNIGYIVRVSGAGSGGWRVAQNISQAIYGNFFTANNYNWQSGYIASKGLNGIASSADGFKMVAVAGGGGVFTTKNSGQTWTNSASIYSLTCVVSSADGSKLVAGNNAGSSPSTTVSADSGNTWASSATSMANCQALAMSADATRQVAVVYGGRIYISANSGTDWALVATSPVNVNKNWKSVASSSDGSRLAAVVTNGQVYTSSNYGTSWALQASPTTNWTAICSSSDGSRLAATVAGGKIYTSSDYGVTWALQTNAPIANWSSIACSSDGGRLLAAVYGGGVYLSANMGYSWSQQPVAVQNWTGVACSADCTKMAAVYYQSSSSGGIYYGQAFLQATTATTTVGVFGSIGGSQGSAVELQYIGNGKFMPVSSTGTIWAN